MESQAADKRARLALAQLNPTVGDIDGNSAKVLEWTERARSEGATLVVFPEMAIAGYPAEDLYLKRQFAEANLEAVRELARQTSGVTVVVGFAEPAGGSAPRVPDAPGPRPVHNALA